MVRHMCHQNHDETLVPQSSLAIERKWLRDDQKHSSDDKSVIVVQETRRLAKTAYFVCKMRRGSTFFIPESTWAEKQRAVNRFTVHNTGPHCSQYWAGLDWTGLVPEEEVKRCVKEVEKAKRYGDFPKWLRTVGRFGTK